MSAGDETLGHLLRHPGAGRSGSASSSGSATASGSVTPVSPVEPDGDDTWAPRRPAAPATRGAGGPDEAPIAIDSYAEPDAAWTTFTPAGPRWRDEARDWAEVDSQDPSLLGDDATRVGTLDPSRDDPSAAYSFDDLDDVAPANRARSPVAPARASKEGSGGGPGEGPGAGDAARYADLAAFGSEIDAAAGSDAPPARSTTRRAAPADARRDRPAGAPGRAPAGPGGSGGSGGSGGARRPRSSAAMAEGERARPVPAAASRPSSVGARIGTGVVVAAVAAVLMIVFDAAGAAVLAVVVLCAAGLELCNALRHRGFRPAVLLALPAIAALVATGYRSTASTELVPLLTLCVIAVLAWYVMGVERDRPVVNMAVTLLVIGYLGVLGSSATGLLRAPDGLALFVAAVAGVAVNDIAAYFVGRAVGRVPLAPEISPNKTVEGLVAGTIASVISVIIVLVLLDKGPFDGATDPILIGLVVGILAPVGDLVESLIKRDLGIKDMGQTLPGHGGVLDRVDAMIVVLPAVALLGRIRGWA
jgi:CDP-diglyceride synthetase